jgi:hypothetical protein
MFWGVEVYCLLAIYQQRDAPTLYFCATNKIIMTAGQTAELCSTLDRSEVLAVYVSGSDYMTFCLYLIFMQ